MKIIFTLIVVASLTLIGCEKDKTAEKPEKEYENVYVNFLINEDLLKPSDGSTYFSRIKPKVYYVSFIADNKVVTKHTIVGKGDRLLVPQRKYDLIVVSSKEYLIEEHKDLTEQEILNSHSYDSSVPYLIGFLKNKQIDTADPLEIQVTTPYATVLIVSSGNMENMNIHGDYDDPDAKDHGIKVLVGWVKSAYGEQEILYHSRSIKKYKSAQVLEKWSMNFTIKVTSSVIFANEELESGKLHIYTVDESTGKYKKVTKDYPWTD